MGASDAARSGCHVQRDGIVARAFGDAFCNALRDTLCGAFENALRVGVRKARGIHRENGNGHRRKRSAHGVRHIGTIFIYRPLFYQNCDFAAI